MPRHFTTPLCLIPQYPTISDCQVCWGCSGLCLPSLPFLPLQHKCLFSAGSSFLKGHSVGDTHFWVWWTLMGRLSKEKRIFYFLRHLWESRGVHSFWLKGMCDYVSKVNKALQFNSVTRGDHWNSEVSAHTCDPRDCEDLHLKAC